MASPPVSVVLVDTDCLLYPTGFSATSRGISEATAVAAYAAKVDRVISDTLLRCQADDLMPTHSPLSLPFQWHFTGRGSPKFRDQFRNTIPYKENRTGARIVPSYIEEMKDWHKGSYPGVIEADPAIGEADDYIAMRAWDTINNGGTPLIVSVDKDLKQIPGWHYNPMTEGFKYIDTNEAVKHFYLQMLIGDSADQIPGLRGYGPKKSARMLENLATELEMFQRVEALYVGQLRSDHSPEEVGDLIYETANLLYLRRHENDYWTPPVE